MDKSAVVEVADLMVKYGEQTVLEGISASVSRGEIKVILGASGCGKTTLLKAIIGLVRPAAGTVKLFGTEVGEIDQPETAGALRKMGVLFQNGALLGSLTVGANLALPLQLHTKLPPDVVREVVQLKLTQVELPHAGPLFPGELSGGMRKRAALARALVMDPPLLFCDEPSAGLDPVTSAGLDQLLLKLRETLGITIVVVTHELLSIETIADSIIFLHKGKLFFDGYYKDARKVTDGPVADFFARKQPETGVNEQLSREFHMEDVS